jgi:hypothetical protein
MDTAACFSQVLQQAQRCNASCVALWIHRQLAAIARDAHDSQTGFVRMPDADGISRFIERQSHDVKSYCCVSNARRCKYLCCMHKLMIYMEGCQCFSLKFLLLRDRKLFLF